MLNDFFGLQKQYGVILDLALLLEKQADAAAKEEGAQPTPLGSEDGPLHEIS